MVELTELGERCTSTHLRIPDLLLPPAIVLSIIAAIVSFCDSIRSPANTPISVAITLSLLSAIILLIAPMVSGLLTT